MELSNEPVTAVNSTKKKMFSKSKSKSKSCYCCCLPISSGVWLIPLVLTIPSLLLVISFNVANIQGAIRFKPTFKIKLFYTLVYSLYAILGVIAGFAFRILAARLRLRFLMTLYWILIVVTIIEGVYFGIMISKQKSKPISYCEEDTNPASTPSNSTIVPPKPSMDLGRTTCRNDSAIVGTFYIVGPCGWIILHIGWILIVVLYSKAFRRQNPIDEESAPIHLIIRPPDNHTTLVGSQLKINSVALQSYPSNNSQDRSLPRLESILRSKISSETYHDRFKSSSMQSIDNDLTITNYTQYMSDSDLDEEEIENNTQRSRHTKQYIHSSRDRLVSSRTEIPLDGKGWWIRQIEGRRHGEVCPCTISNPGSLEDVTCWCGKQRWDRCSQSTIPTTSST